MCIKLRRPTKIMFFRNMIGKPEVLNLLKSCQKKYHYITETHVGNDTVFAKKLIIKFFEQCRPYSNCTFCSVSIVRTIYTRLMSGISLFLFFPLSGVRCCLQLFHRLICYSSPLSSVSCLFLPVSLLSCLLHISLYTVLPSQYWPPSSPPALLT